MSSASTQKLSPSSGCTTVIVHFLATCWNAFSESFLSNLSHELLHRLWPTQNSRLGHYSLLNKLLWSSFLLPSLSLIFYTHIILIFCTLSFFHSLRSTSSISLLVTPAVLVVTDCCALSQVAKHLKIPLITFSTLILSLQPKLLLKHFLKSFTF